MNARPPGHPGRDWGSTSLPDGNYSSGGRLQLQRGCDRQPRPPPKAYGESRCNRTSAKRKETAGGAGSTTPWRQQALAARSKNRRETRETHSQQAHARSRRVPWGENEARQARAREVVWVDCNCRARPDLKIKGGIVAKPQGGGGGGAALGMQASSATHSHQDQAERLRYSVSAVRCLGSARSRI